jgi:hypothetical protein
MYISPELPADVDWTDPASYGPYLWGNDAGFDGPNEPPPADDPGAVVEEDTGGDDTGAEPDANDDDGEAIVDDPEHVDGDDNGVAPVPPPTLEMYTARLNEYISQRDEVIEAKAEVESRRVSVINGQQTYDDLLTRLQAEQAKPLAQQNAVLIGQLEIDLEDASISLSDRLTNLGTAHANYVGANDSAKTTKEITETLRSSLNQAGHDLAAIPDLPSEIDPETVFPQSSM